MDNLDIRVSYAVGYLEALLGSPSVDLSPEAQKRIAHAIAVLRGSPMNTASEGENAQVVM
jgi:hypothetical protein